MDEACPAARGADRADVVARYVFVWPWDGIERSFAFTAVRSPFLLMRFQIVSFRQKKKYSMQREEHGEG